MKLYGGKFLRTSMNNAVERKVESRDAILYDVDTQTRKARVRIQGSSTLIVVFYPENWEQTPVWLKPGNAVKITHTGGNRSRLELTGHGSLIPTPVAGDTGIPAVVLPDVILTGLTLTPINVLEPAHSGIYPWESVLVSTGTFRIAGSTYTLPPIKMGNANYNMGNKGKMGQVGGLVTMTGDVGTTTSGTFKYNDIYIGTDLILDYLTSAVINNTDTNPAHPALPANHIRLGWVLHGRRLSSYTYTAPLVEPQDYIAASFINKNKLPPEIPTLSMIVADTDLAIAELTTTVTIDVLNNQGTPYTPDSGSWSIQLDIMNTTVDGLHGLVKNSTGTTSISSVIGTTTGSRVTFTYIRNGADTDLTAVLKAKLIGFYSTAISAVIVRDTAGNPLPM